jgi:hypothetical protein
VAGEVVHEGKGGIGVRSCARKKKGLRKEVRIAARGKPLGAGLGRVGG